MARFLVMVLTAFIVFAAVDMIVVGIPEVPDGAFGTRPKDVHLVWQDQPGLGPDSGSASEGQKGGCGRKGPEENPRADQLDLDSLDAVVDSLYREAWDWQLRSLSPPTRPVSSTWFDSLLQSSDEPDSMEGDPLRYQRDFPPWPLQFDSLFWFNRSEEPTSSMGVQSRRAEPGGC
jgi:hypothetical protein